MCRNERWTDGFFFEYCKCPIRSRTWSWSDALNRNARNQIPTSFRFSLVWVDSSLRLNVSFSVRLLTDGFSKLLSSVKWIWVKFSSKISDVSANYGFCLVLWRPLSKVIIFYSCKPILRFAILISLYFFFLFLVLQVKMDQKLQPLWRLPVKEPTVSRRYLIQIQRSLAMEASVLSSRQSYVIPANWLQSKRFYRTDDLR